MRFGGRINCDARAGSLRRQPTPSSLCADSNGPGFLSPIDKIVVKQSVTIPFEKYFCESGNRCVTDNGQHCPFGDLPYAADLFAAKIDGAEHLRELVHLSHGCEPDYDNFTRTTSVG